MPVVPVVGCGGGFNTSTISCTVQRVFNSAGRILPAFVVVVVAVAVSIEEVIAARTLQTMSTVFVDRYATTTSSLSLSSSSSVVVVVVVSLILVNSCTGRN